MLSLKVVPMPKSFAEDDEYAAAIFGPDDMHILKTLEFDIAWYWYARSMYEGAGALIGFDSKSGLFAIVDLGHCSCHGPLDKDRCGDPLEKSDLTWHPLIDCIKSHTEHGYKEYENLYKAIVEYFVRGREDYW